MYRDGRLGCWRGELPMQLAPKFDRSLLAASYHGQLDVVKLLLEDGRSNPACGADKHTIARLKAHGQGDLEIPRILEDGLFGPFSDDDPCCGQNAALRAAAIGGHVEVVQLLLSESRIDPADDDGFIIHWTARAGHLQLVDRLLDEKQSQLSKSDVAQFITGAITGKQIDVIKHLLQLRDRRLSFGTDVSGVEQLHGRINYGWADDCRSFAEEVALLLARHFGCALEWAAQNENPELLRALLAEPDDCHHDTIEKDSFEAMRRAVDSCEPEGSAYLPCLEYLVPVITRCSVAPYWASIWKLFSRCGRPANRPAAPTDTGRTSRGVLQRRVHHPSRRRRGGALCWPKQH